MAEKMTIRKKCINPTSASLITTFTERSCGVVQIAISILAASGGLTIRVQDRDTAPFVMIPTTVINPPSDPQPGVLIHIKEPITMRNGVDVITENGTGQLHIWLTIIPTG